MNIPQQIPELYWKRTNADFEVFVSYLGKGEFRYIMWLPVRIRHFLSCPTLSSSICTNLGKLASFSHFAFQQVRHGNVRTYLKITSSYNFPTYNQDYGRYPRCSKKCSTAKKDQSMQSFNFLSHLDSWFWPDWTSLIRKLVYRELNFSQQINLTNIRHF